MTLGDSGRLWTIPDDFGRLRMTPPPGGTSGSGVEVLGRGGRVDDLQVDRVPVRAGFARVRHLQEALNAAGAVLGGGPIVAVGQQHHQPIADHPFRCGEVRV